MQEYFFIRGEGEATHFPSLYWGQENAGPGNFGTTLYFVTICYTIKASLSFFLQFCVVFFDFDRGVT